MKSYPYSSPMMFTVPKRYENHPKKTKKHPKMAEMPKIAKTAKNCRVFYKMAAFT